MICSRCGCKMVLQEIYGESEKFTGWSCLKCGEFIDPTILKNREESMGEGTKWTEERRAKFLETLAKKREGGGAALSEEEKRGKKREWDRNYHRRKSMKQEIEKQIPAADRHSAS